MRIMETSPVRKMTIMKELKMENQWICSPPEADVIMTQTRGANGADPHLVLKKVVVEVSVEPLRKGNVGGLPLHRVGELQRGVWTDGTRILGCEVHLDDLQPRVEGGTSADMSS